MCEKGGDEKTEKMDERRAEDRGVMCEKRGRWMNGMGGSG